MSCPEPEALSAFSRGGLEAPQRAGIEHHLDGCQTCARVVSELARIYTTDQPQLPSMVEPADYDGDTLADESLPGPRPKTHLQPGERLDRYHILELVGSGGMGVVYAAYDPDLDRKVALKALHGRGEPTDERAQRRLLREAQAMARLAHPNVITVHEVRVIDGRVFVSMEFVEGGTLGDWLERTQPSRAQLLAMFQDVGRGLAAAHDAGLVHRDVKPDNVLIGRDQRPRVTDFGLARPTDEAEALRSSRPLSGPVAIEAGLADATITRTKGLVGTPAYMAPEQFMREPATAATDQFSFCVALYEALYGTRPFVGSTFAELAAHVLDGVLAEPAHDPSVPRWLRQVVMRGLSRKPEDRWPSMDVLVERLEPGPRRARRRLVAVGAMAVVLVGAGSMASQVLSAPPDPCDAGERSMEELWGPGSRARVQQALARGATAYSEQTARLAVQRIDDYTAQWVASHRDACEGYHRGEQSDEALDLRGACLDERRRELEALLDVLDKGEPEVRRHAIQAVDELRSLGPCNDVETLRARVSPPEDPAVRRRVQEIDGTLARVRARQHAGQYEAGLALAQEAVAAATQTDYAPLRARALRERAALHQRRGDYEDAVADLRLAWPTALAAGDDALAAECVVDLVDLLGHNLREYELAALRIADAEAMIERVRRHDSRHAEELEVSLLSARGRIEMRHFRFEEALHLYGQALERAERLSGVDSLRVASVLNSTSSARLASGDWQQALELYQRVLAIRIKHLGVAHPETAHMHNNVGLTLKNLSRLPEAADHLERALEILEASLDPEHPSITMARTNLAEVYHRQLRYPEAIALYRVVFEPLPTPVEHEGELRKFQHYGAALGRAGEPEDARRVLRRVRELAREFGSLDVVRTCTTELARVELGAEDYQAALDEIARLPAPPSESEKFDAELAFVRASALAGLGRAEEARPLVPTVRALVGEVGTPSEADLAALLQLLGDDAQ